jgi:cytochrome c-type biogenesis protein
MSFLGKGFSGPQIQQRPAVGLLGSYFYGATFALGWTACIGPILGTLYTLMATQGLAVLQGALLAFIYALGLGLPLVVVASFFSRLGPGSRFWRFARGRGFEIKLGSRTLYLHTTSMISGLLMIVMGFLLATDQLTRFNSMTQAMPLAQWVTQLEEVLTGFFGLR